MLDLSDTLSILLGLLVFGVLLRISLKQRARKIDGTKRLPPSMPALPIVGSLPFFKGGMENLPKFFMSQAGKMGPVFLFYSGRKLAVAINGRDALVEALVRHGEAFGDRPDHWTEVNLVNVNRKGLSFGHYNERYKKNRKLTLSIMKELGFGVTDTMEKIILERVELMIEDIRKHNGVAFDPNSYLAFHTASMVMNTLFGKQFLSTGNYCHDIIENGELFIQSFDLKLDTAPIIRFLPSIRKKLQNMVRSSNALIKLMEGAIKFNKSNQCENTFVKRYMDIAGSSYDHEDLLYLLRDLSFSSADTIATVLKWALVELINHPPVLERIQKEIDDVIPRNRLPVIEDKTRLPYTEATMLEVLRYRTLEPVTPRYTVKDTKICGYDIPKDCMVMANFYSAHHDPKLWKDPHNFRPERFLDEDNKIIGRELVTPFSLGKRSCPGEIIARPALFLCIASLVQNFDILPPEGHDSVTVKEEYAVLACPSAFQCRFIPKII